MLSLLLGDEERIIDDPNGKSTELGSFMCNNLVTGPTNVASSSHIPYLVLLGSYPKSRAKLSICNSASGTYIFLTLILIIKLFPEIPGSPN